MSRGSWSTVIWVSASVVIANAIAAGTLHGLSEAYWPAQATALRIGSVALLFLITLPTTLWIQSFIINQGLLQKIDRLNKLLTEALVHGLPPVTVHYVSTTTTDHPEDKEDVSVN